jgi:acetyl-CoA carboxylase biotin carboxylase subunit
LRKFKKVLIANRGEIAVRIHRACREMGIATVAVHSTADNDALHVKMANESVCIGEAQADKSYLNIPAILSAAEVTDVEAIHPGYGFLSENPKFAEIVDKLGFTFIGPKAEHITLMGDKVAALKCMQKMKVQTIPGSGGPIRKDDEAVKVANKIGYPVLIKAAAGGGGRGMKVAHSDMALRKAIATAKAEAKAAFGDDRIYLEKFLEKPRHIEVQILADMHGNVVTLGERDCSLQRRYQKIIEESPSPVITPKQREYLSELCIRICKDIDYIGCGTIEFLYENGEFYFIEMNTRLQVEHPVTEMVTGVDLVQEQIRVAMGEKLQIKKNNIALRGHAIECRINAENAETFRPSPGTVTEYFTPGGPEVRVDSCLYHNCTIPPYYDAMVAKLIVHGATRDDAIRRLQRALEEFIVEGVDTILPLHQRLVATNAFAKGEYDIHSIGRFIENKNL